MSTYTKEKGISVLIIIMSALLAITGVPYMGESIFIIAFLLTAYLITACIVKKSGYSVKKRIALLMGAYGILCFVFYVILNAFDIGWPEVVIFITLVSGWPLILYGITEILEKFFPDRISIRVLLFIFAACAGILWDITAWNDHVSFIGGSVRPDHIFYFMIIAGVIGYKRFIPNAGKATIKIAVMITLTVVIIGTMIAVFSFGGRWKEVIGYTFSYLNGNDTGMDWVGYRIAALKGYWLHDFDTMRVHYPNEGYYWTLEVNGPIKYAYEYGSWTSVVMIVLEIGICVCMGIVYSRLRKSAILKPGSCEIWNVVPFLIFGYAVRTAIGLIEHMFMLSLWKMELPFTGRSAIDLLIPVMLLLALMCGTVSEDSRVTLGKWAVCTAAIFISLYVCVSICISLTNATKEKLHDEALREKWDYNDYRKSEAEKEAWEYFKKETGKDFLLVEVSEYITEDGLDYAKWGISDDEVLYIHGDDSVAYLGEQYQRAMDEKGVDCEIRKAVVMNGVKYIGYETFYNLPDLKEVEIAPSVLDVGQNAFSKCGKLERVCLEGRRTQIYSDSFYDCSEYVVIEGRYADSDNAAYRTHLQFENIGYGMIETDG